MERSTSVARESVVQTGLAPHWMPFSISTRYLTRVPASAEPTTSVPPPATVNVPLAVLGTPSLVLALPPPVSPPGLTFFTVADGFALGFFDGAAASSPTPSSWPTGNGSLLDRASADASWGGGADSAGAPQPASTESSATVSPIRLARV